MNARVIALMFVGTVACAERRSPPVKYPDKCGSHVECFTQSLLYLDEAHKALEAAQQAAQKLVPVGTVVAYVGNSVPPNWMFCDGTALNKNDYPALFEAVGVTHGGDANPNFQLPDYRGLFLRGRDAGANRDPDAGSRSAMGSNGTGNRGEAVGTYQPDALQVHQHSVTYDFSATGSNGTRDADEGTKKYNTHPPHARLRISIGDPTGARVSAETRPANVTVNWIIKVR